MEKSASWRKLFRHTYIYVQGLRTVPLPRGICFPAYFSWNFQNSCNLAMQRLSSNMNDTETWLCFLRWNIFNRFPIVCPRVLRPDHKSVTVAGTYVYLLFAEQHNATRDIELPTAWLTSYPVVQFPMAGCSKINQSHGRNTHRRLLSL